LERKKDSRVYHSNRLPKDEVTHMIEELIEMGLDPDEIRNKLEGMAPTSFIMEYTMKLWERKLMEREQRDKNA